MLNHGRANLVRPPSPLTGGYQSARFARYRQRPILSSYVKSGVISCAKHFPGHGNTLIDSHEDLPVENADLNRLNEVELVPFKRSIKSRVDMVMTSHLKFPNIDPEWPVTLSETFIKNILKEVK